MKRGAQLNFQFAEDTKGGAAGAKGAKHAVACTRHVEQGATM